jgi:DNA invertase Pin-like site-specific DNA recombinase
MKRAATYARFSTDKQTETSIDDQRRACNEYAKQNGLQVVHEFADLAISGAAFGNRPGIKDLQRAAFAGEIDVILIADLTRMSRQSADLLKFLERVRFRKIRVIGVLDHFDSDQRHSRMQAGLSGIMSDEYRAAVGERTHLAMNSLAQKGKPTGGVLYGYTSKREIIPEQARVVREIFKRAAAGEPIRAIASDLNARQVPCAGAHIKRTSHGRWVLPTLAAMLRNEMYIGRVVWNRSQMIKDPDRGTRLRRARPRSEWNVTEHPELALIARSTWDAVQERIARRKSAVGPNGGGRSRYPLSGMLECGECGGSFILAGGGKNTVKSYACCTRHYGGSDACANSIRVPMDLCVDELLEPALTELLSDAAVHRGVARIRKLLKEQPAETQANVAQLEAKVAQVRALVASGALDADMAEPVFAKLDAERAALRHAAHRVPVIPFGIEAEYRAHARRLRDDLKGEDADAARAALVECYGPRVRLLPDPTRKHLIAEVYLQTGALLAAAGGVTRISLHSGHPLCTHIPLIPKA